MVITNSHFFSICFFLCKVLRYNNIFICLCQYFFKNILKYFFLYCCCKYAKYFQQNYNNIFIYLCQYFFKIIIKFFLIVHSKNNSNAKSIYNLCNYFFYFFFKSFICWYKSQYFPWLSIYFI